MIKVESSQEQELGRTPSCIKLCREEIIEKVNEIFSKYDFDQNGVLDKEEIRPYFFGQKEKQELCAQIVFEEFFHELDTDGDQVITKVELFKHIWKL